MNQQQRKYIVKELGAAKRKKIEAITEGNSSAIENDGIIAEVVAAVKDGRITKNSDSKEMSSIYEYTTPKYMKKLITRDFGYFSNNGVVRIKYSSLISAIKEFSANAWSVSKHYNHKRGMINFTECIKNGCNEPDVVTEIVKGHGNNIDERIAKVNTAYKLAERKTMLADSEEMMVAIESFENMEF